MTIALFVVIRTGWECVGGAGFVVSYRDFPDDLTASCCIPSTMPGLVGGGSEIVSPASATSVQALPYVQSFS